MDITIYNKISSQHKAKICTYCLDFMIRRLEGSVAITCWIVETGLISDICLNALQRLADRWRVYLLLILELINHVCSV